MIQKLSFARQPRKWLLWSFILALLILLTSSLTPTVTASVQSVTMNNAALPEPPAPADTFQSGHTNDTTGQYITYPFELEEEGGGGPPGGSQPSFETSMTAEISNIVVIPGDGVIGGDVIEFDVTLTNTSSDPGAVMTAFAFQSKFSESPALASRIGDKAFYGVLVSGGVEGQMVSVKKNGTSNGLFGGRWKGICINSSTDYIPEFNAGLEDESLECGGNRADNDHDGLPELQFPIQGISPGDSQTVRIRIEAGTTDGALHVIEPGTLRGLVQGIEQIGPNGITYYTPEINNAGYTDDTGTYPAVTDPNVLSIPDFADNKVYRNADGTFNPTFAPLTDGYTFDKQIYLTLPRRNFAFTDILGRNHTCGTYGLDLINGIPCSGNPGLSPVFGFLDTGDLLPGIPNFAAILHGFGEYAIDADGNPILDVNGNYTAPMFPYGVPCVNLATPDGLRCGARPFTPIAEFYKDNGDGTLTQQVVAGSYGALGSADQYTASFNVADAEDWKEETIPELDPGGPCNAVADPDSNKPSCAQLSTSATAHFHSLIVVSDDPNTPQNEGGTNGGDFIEFTIDVTNTSANPEAYLTAFNYQTKERNLADIGGLDGYTQDRRDIRLDSSLPLCTSLTDDGQCYNATLGIGQFPNVIGNGLLFGQMVWATNNVDRAGQEIVPDFVYVDPINGIDPVDFKLESVKKNGPFTPILKGNVNFICLKSGLFAPDQDADASCAGEPAILIDENGEPVPSNVSQRLGLAPGETQSVRIRMEYGDFRGAMLQIAPNTLTSANVNSFHAATGGLARQFDCEDQRELEYCHPELVGDLINYLPNTNATWLAPQTLEEIEYVIINQPGDAPRLMDFQANFGYILAMAGFIPSAEFYAPDPNEDLIGTPYEGVLIRQQVLGEYSLTEPSPMPAAITSAPQTSGETGTAYSYQVTAVGYPAPTFSLTTAPSGMTIDGNSGLISWPSPVSGLHNVEVVAQNSSGSAVQPFQVNIASTAVAPQITSTPVTSGGAGSAYSYQVTATGDPAPTFSLTTAPAGMTINSSTGLITWASPTSGLHNVQVVAQNSAGSVAQSFQVSIATPILDNFNRANGRLGPNWDKGRLLGYGITSQQVSILTGGPAYWTAQSFGTSQAASVTLNRIDTRGGNHGLILKAQGGSSPHWLNGAIVVTYLPGQEIVRVTSYQPKKLGPALGWWILADIPAEFSNGDRLAAEALADGSVRVYKNGTLIGTASTTGVHGNWFATRGGNTGVWFMLGSKARFDDFGGGNLN